MAETWDEAEITTFIEELLDTSGNDFNAVLAEIEKLKGDMNKDSESENQAHLLDLFDLDPEEMRKIEEEARKEAEQR